jgi:hypothetical protein
MSYHNAGPDPDTTEDPGEVLAHCKMIGTDAGAVYVQEASGRVHVSYLTGDTTVGLHLDAPAAIAVADWLLIFAERIVERDAAPAPVEPPPF